jgi:glycine/sarcosine N-methyltransferase
MSGDTVAFYNDLAEHYHLIFEDWDRSIDRQADVLGPLLTAKVGPAPLEILDCACGIGTQTIGLARLGHTVVASDFSDAAVRRAERETVARGLEVKFHVADMRNLSSLSESGFDAALAGDNSLPHLLSDEDLTLALKNIHTLLKPKGVLVATIRDYDNLLQTRPAFQAPAFYSDNGRRRIVHQVWDWSGNEYMVHLHLSWETDSSWVAKHYVTHYRALKRSELSESLTASGFHQIEWLMPQSTGLYQPIVIARKEATSA